MELDAVHRLNNQVDAAAARLHRQTGQPVIILGLAETPTGQTGAVYSAHGPTPGQLEFAILALLMKLEGEVASGAAEGCDDCQARYLRVSSAVAAIKAGFPTGTLPAGGTC